jgi:hypothetical protein
VSDVEVRPLSRLPTMARRTTATSASNDGAAGPDTTRGGGTDMLTMAVGHSDDVDADDAITIAIDQCRDQLKGLAPKAGIMIAAFDSFGPSIIGAVREAFPGIALMGSSSSAEMSSTGGFLEDSVSLALFASDEIDMTAGLGVGLDSDLDAACEAAVWEARAATEREPKVCVVFADGFVAEPQRTLDGLARALPEGVVVVGGGSARHDLGAGAPSWQFCNERIASDGIAVLLLSGPLAFSIAVGTGWRTLGASGTITRSGPGQVEEIDGRPAMEFLGRYLDVTGPASFGNPLSVQELGADQTYLRAITGSDAASGTVSLFGSIPVGATVQVTTATTEDILGGTRRSLAEASSAFPEGVRPEAALMFSCAVRQLLLGSRARTEVELAMAEFGPSVPLAGLYCFGEIGPLGGSPTSRFLNETFVTLLLGT